MKAMAQEALRRYGSAAELASDVERYLQHQPIEARPPTASYLLGLFVRRHRAVSAASAVALLALICGAAVSLYYAVSDAPTHPSADGHAAAVPAAKRFRHTMTGSTDPPPPPGRPDKGRTQRQG